MANENTTKTHNFTLDTESDKDVEAVLQEWSRTRRKSEKIREAIRLWIRYNEVIKNQEANQLASSESSIIKKQTKVEVNEINPVIENEKQENKPVKETKKNSDVLPSDMFKSLMRDRNK